MTIGTRLRTSFVTGMFLVTPLAVTVFVVQFVFKQLTGVLNPIVSATRLTAYTGNIEVVAQLLAAVLLALTITTLGFLASWGVGQRMFGSFERGVRLIPLVRSVYFGVRQVSESLSQRSAGYESVVLVEYPREGSYVVGFVTNEAPRAVQDATDEDLHTVFLPNSPNPTAGRLLLVEVSRLIELDVGVRHGLRLLITTGLTGDEDDLPESVGR